MFVILEMGESCVTDLLGGRCKAANHYWRDLQPAVSACTPIVRTRLRPPLANIGLTPDDVHDSFNMWMNTEWDSRGQYWITRNTGREKDYVDLLALFDVLAVPIICGSGDTQITSNYGFKPIRVQVFKPSAYTKALCKNYELKFGNAQRTLNDFKVKKIQSRRQLKRVPNYSPEFVNYPIRSKRDRVELTADEHAALEQLKENYNNRCLRCK